MASAQVVIKLDPADYTLVMDILKEHKDLMEGAFKDFDPQSDEYRQHGQEFMTIDRIVRQIEGR